ncbi:MAG: MATE family efflux transporter [Mesotoga sp.]|uniref:MATE family efflux transporter n=1 Tax=unclassified Mesotoga TaxID=1184398 RepID=UPI000FF471DD|nr:MULTISPECIES: MATE family efflux transporter [unclassified Mesotoga]MDI9366870.1 MATE family efflux transporter [Thermotogota bacterium]MDD2333439.1 MATE family efflux transporter [Mesotoga sp.]MDD3680113.1 MATE family efflux transporter [Mesotoga sp.]MDD4206633.1 MATE family efflux transporter [Mesotoga sp.]MDD4824789.1 MATE family efflux transporter [Mesotoga sp.]
MARDLTQGNILKNLLVMSVPTMIGFSAQMIYDIVDIFWIGRISGEAIAGVTIFTTLFWIVDILNSIIGQSSISLISQSYGKRDLEGSSNAIEQTITFKFIVALISALLVAAFLKPSLGFFTTDPKVVTSALDYGYIRLFFLPMMFSSYSVNTALRCIGDAKSPMYIMMVASVLNIVLDPIMMFDRVPGTGIPGFGLGVFGAAVATVIAQTASFLFGFYILFSGREGVKPKLSRLFRLDRNIDKKLLTIGLPTGLEGFFRNLAAVVVLKFVAVYGTTAVAAVGVTGRLFGLAFMPLVGLSMGGSAMVGQNLGADNVGRARATAKTAALIGFFFMFAFALIAFFAGELVISIFNSDPEIISYGASFLKYGALGISVLAYGFGLSAVFGGSGYNFPFVVGSVVSRWLIQVPILIIAVTVMKASIVWVWLSYVFSDIAEAAIMILYYLRGKWEKRRVY